MSREAFNKHTNILFFLDAQDLNLHSLSNSHPLLTSLGLILVTRFIIFLTKSQDPKVVLLNSVMCQL